MSDLTINQKIKLISRLAEAGIDTEKKLNDLSVENMLKIPNITIPDIHNFLELKQVVKSGKLFSYLNGVNESEAK